MQYLSVVFRAERKGDHAGEVTAVFPTLDANPGRMVCYAHIGQHGECTNEWYFTTRPATEAEYESLLKEVRSIYEADGDCTLVVRKRRA